MNNNLPYCSDLDDEIYGNIYFESSRSQILSITVVDAGVRDFVSRIDLPPTKEGFETAEKIIAAIKEWMNQCKQVDV